MFVWSCRCLSSFSCFSNEKPDKRQQQRQKKKDLRLDIRLEESANKERPQADESVVATRHEQAAVPPHRCCAGSWFHRSEIPPCPPGRPSPGRPCLHPEHTHTQRKHSLTQRLNRTKEFTAMVAVQAFRTLGGENWWTLNQQKQDACWECREGRQWGQKKRTIERFILLTTPVMFECVCVMYWPFLGWQSRSPDCFSC